MLYSYLSGSCSNGESSRMNVHVGRALSELMLDWNHGLITGTCYQLTNRSEDAIESLL